jgi:hypothetical protein
MDALSTLVASKREIPGSTLLMLMMSVNESTDSADEAEAAIHYLLDTKQVRLTGNFRGTLLRDYA